MAASLMAAPRHTRVRYRRAQTAGTAVGFTADKGKFRILQGGSEVGTEEFDLAPSGERLDR